MSNVIIIIIFLFISQEGEFDKAEKIFHIALRMAQDVNHQDAILYIHDLLANLAFETVSHIKWDINFIFLIQKSNISF